MSPTPTPAQIRAAAARLVSQTADGGRSLDDLLAGDADEGSARGLKLRLDLLYEPFGRSLGGGRPLGARDLQPRYVQHILDALDAHEALLLHRAVARQQLAQTLLRVLCRV